MLEATDARGRTIQLAAPPERIVSLVPSATDTLFALGAGDRLVGRTIFCCHPAEHLVGVPKVGGTKNADPDKILALKPDLVVANCEENTNEIFEALDPHVPVWAPFPRSVDEAIADLRTLGHLVGRDAEAAASIARIEEERTLLHAAARPFSYTYLIWREPWMAVSDDTFIAAMLAEAGGDSEVAGQPRFPEVSLEDLTRRDGAVLLSSEPFPFSEKHATELVGAGIARERLHFVDGELLSWHGTRMEPGLRYLRELLPRINR